MSQPLVVVSATSFANTTPYLQSEWLLDSIARPLQDGMSFARAASTTSNTLIPRWAVDGSQGEVGKATRNSTSSGVKSATYLTTQTPVAYTYLRNHVVVFIDLDDSMLSVQQDGSVSLDGLTSKLSSAVEDLYAKTAERGIEVQLVLCAQHVESGVVRTLYEGMLATFVKFMPLTQMRKLLWRHLCQPHLTAKSADATTMLFALEYCESHFKVLEADTCPIILFSSAGLRRTDVKACSALLSGRRVTFHALVAPSPSFRVPDLTSLAALSKCTGGRVFTLTSDSQAIAEYLLRPLYYEPASGEVKREGSGRVLLSTYNLEGLLFQHVIALRVLDGFQLIAAFSEAGRYHDSSTSDRRLAYKYTFRFSLTLSKQTSLIYEVSCMIFQKTVQLPGRRHRSAKAYFRASRGHYTPPLVKIFSESVPVEWSSFIAADRMEYALKIASQYQVKDQKLADNMNKVISIFDGSNGKRVHRISTRPALSGDSEVVNSLYYPVEFPEPNELTVSDQLRTLSVVIKEVSSLDVLGITYIYLRGLEMLTDLRQNAKFRSLIVSKISDCVGSECSFYDLGDLTWLLSGPLKSGPVIGGSSISNAAFSCPDILRVSVQQTGGVFIHLVLSRFRIGPGHKNFYFRSNNGLEDIPKAVNGALASLNFLPEILTRDLLPLYTLATTGGTAFRNGILCCRGVKYPLDFSDPHVFSSVLDEISAAKLNSGFQINCNTSDGNTTTAVMHFCAVVSAVLCDKPVKTLIQCHVICREDGLCVHYFCEQEFLNARDNKTRAALSSLIKLFCEQDECILKLYKAVISVLSQLPRNVPHAAETSNIRLSFAQWNFLSKNSDCFEFFLPSFDNVGENCSENRYLAKLLVQSLIRGDEFVDCIVDPSIAESSSRILCKRIDTDSFIIIELLSDPASGYITIQDQALSSSDSKNEFYAFFPACLTVKFRLLKLPLMRTFLHTDLSNLLDFFGMISNTNITLNKSKNDKCEETDAIECLPDTVPHLLHQSSRSYATSLYNNTKASLFHFHLCNYAIVLYSKIRNQQYTPSSNELHAALYYCRVVTHEIDISTLCISKQSALTMCGRDKIKEATIGAFRATAGAILSPIENSEFFIYVPNQAEDIMVPVFVKASFVLSSQHSIAAQNIFSCEPDPMITAPGRCGNVYYPNRTVYSEVLDCLFGSSARFGAISCDGLIANSLINISSGLSPTGYELGDTPLDYILRVESSIPRIRTSEHDDDIYLMLHEGSNLCPASKEGDRRGESATGGLIRALYSDFALQTALLASELDRFVALDILDSLAVIDSPTPETLVLAQHCLKLIPHVLNRTISLDILSPSSLSTRNIPDVATNMILFFLDEEIQSYLGASKIGWLLISECWYLNFNF